MLSSIILALVSAALIGVAEHLFASRGPLRVDGRWDYSAIDLGECSRALGIGGAIGVVNYFSPKLSGNWLIIAPIFMLVMAAIFLWLTFRERNRFSWLGFCLMAGAVLWPAFTFKSAAEATVALLKADGFWKELICGLPWGFFILLAGGTIVFALKAEAEDPHQEANRARLFFGLFRVVAFVVALLIIASLLNFKWPSWSNASERVAKPIESSGVVTTEAAKETETEAETKPVVEDTRDPRFIQEAIGHENWRLCDDFSVRLGERAKEDKRTEVVPQDTTDEVLTLCGHSAELLKFYASSEAFKLCSAESDVKELLTSDGTYLSDEGIALYYRLEGAFKMCKQERAFAPASGTNTGWDSGVVVAENPGISGETKSTRYTTPSGYAFDVMDRCANIVFHNPPKDYPEGRTDEKDPSKAPKTNTEPGDGPDPSTNNGVGSKVSAADQPNNSGSKTYEEYVKDNSELQKTNEEQQQGGSPNTPSTRPSGDVTVDNNGDGDSGHAPIDEQPTPTAPLAKTEDGEPIATDPGVPWGGPPD